MYAEYAQLINMPPIPTPIRYTYYLFQKLTFTHLSICLVHSKRCASSRSIKRSQWKINESSAEPAARHC